MFLKMFCVNSFKSIKAVELDMVFMNEVLVISLLSLYCSCEYYLTVTKM